ncbi:MAG: imidazoleglycerol-phosphate dehydratase HisB [Deltaproteobacteria bacterium]|nr:imidazoleglycerol-phosphate dehydratase HisB [Deltaproteobacteria bacterium]
MKRDADIERKTRETDIQLRLNLDGKGYSSIDIDIPFLGHMFELMAAHGFMDLDVKAKGDIEIDYHHTVEDLGICLGKAINQALGDKKAIKRYGLAMVPMDESLAQVVIDISNRPYLSYRVPLNRNMTGKFDVGLLEEFFKALVNYAGITMHIKLISGSDAHHIAEAIFKAFARALDQASQREERLDDVPSTKGLL